MFQMKLTVIEMSEARSIPDPAEPGQGAMTDVSQILGVPRADSPLHWINKIESGLPAKSIRNFARRYALPDNLISEILVMSRSTLMRRRKDGRLTESESDDLVRIAGLYAMAENVLEGKDSAAQWMREPNRSLGGAAPIDYARTTIGSREVENLLGRIEHGIAA